MESALLWAAAPQPLAGARAYVVGAAPPFLRARRAGVRRDARPWIFALRAGVACPSLQSMGRAPRRAVRPCSAWDWLGSFLMDPVLQVRGLSYRYPDGAQALKVIDLDIQAGERVAVIGPNGAGKSTLFFHLNGTFRGEGEILIKGNMLSDKTLYEVRRTVGLVFQDPNDQLFMPTVFEDVAFSPMNLGCSETEVRD